MQDWTGNSERSGQVSKVYDTVDVPHVWCDHIFTLMYSSGSPCPAPIRARLWRWPPGSSPRAWSPRPEVRVTRWAAQHLSVNIRYLQTGKIQELFAQHFSAEGFREMCWLSHAFCELSIYISGSVRRSKSHNVSVCTICLQRQVFLSTQSLSSALSQPFFFFLVRFWDANNDLTFIPRFGSWWRGTRMSTSTPRWSRSGICAPVRPSSTPSAAAWQTPMARTSTLRTSGSSSMRPASSLPSTISLDTWRPSNISSHSRTRGDRQF